MKNYFNGKVKYIKKISKVLAYVLTFTLVLGSINVIGLSASGAAEDNELVTEENANVETTELETEEAGGSETTELETEEADSPETAEVETEEADSPETAEVETGEADSPETAEVETEEADSPETAEIEDERNKSEEDAAEDEKDERTGAASSTMKKVHKADPMDLAKSLVGEGIDILDVKVSGAVNIVDNVDPSLGISGGVVLDTSGNPDGPSDSDLVALSNGYNYKGHTATLEIKMKANGNLLNFNYVFASGEFDQGAQFNDIFGLFVKVGEGAFENIALLDNGRPVTITNLRAGRDKEQFNKGINTNIKTGEVYDYFTAVSGIGFTDGGFNGITNKFTAQKTVNKGDIVTVKFSIADVGDFGVNSYVIIEQGSLNFAPDSKIDYEEEMLNNLKPENEYEITYDDIAENGEKTEVIVKVKTDDKGTIPLEGEGVDQSGAKIEYSLLGKDISIVQLDTDDNGTVSRSDPQELKISERPDTPPDPNVPQEVVDGNKPVDLKPGDVKTTSTEIIIIKPAPGQEYSIDGGKTWKRADTNDEIVFSKNEPEYNDLIKKGIKVKIITRFYATDSTPKSYASDGVDVVPMDMMEPEVTPYFGVYDGEYHCARFGNLPEDSVISYSDSDEGEYSKDIIQFKDVGEYKLYYLIEAEDYYPYYGYTTVTITKRMITVTPDENQKKYVGEKDGELKYSYYGELPDESPAFTGMLVRDPGEEEGFYSIKQGTLGFMDKNEFKAFNYELNFTDDVNYSIICHKWGTEVKENIIHSTCTQSGSYDLVVYCSECGKILKKETVITPESGHSFTEDGTDGGWVKIVSPKCSVKGSEMRTCMVCGFVETRSLDPNGHNWVNENGVEEYTVDKEPTCLANGSKSIHCTREGCTAIKDSEVLPRKNHVAVLEDGTAPTCVKTGITNGSHCELCGAVLKAQTQLDATGHNWGLWNVVKEATFEYEGEKERICLNGCGEKQTEYIAKLVKPGVLTKGVKLVEGAPITLLNNDEISLSKASGILDENDKSNMETGEDATIWLEVSPVDSEELSSKEKRAVKKKAENAIGKDVKIQYIDISMFKKVGDGEAVRIHEPGDMISITITIPEGLTKYDLLTVRKHGIIRVHDGKAEVLKGKYNKATREFTFDTDKFSTFAIGYANSPKKKEKLDKTPDMGDDELKGQWRK